MSVYKVRVHTLGLAGYLTQADHYHDFELESAETLETFSRRLAAEGFRSPEKPDHWIMPGSIFRVEQVE